MSTTYDRSERITKNIKIKIVESIIYYSSVEINFTTHRPLRIVTVWKVSSVCKLIHHHSSEDVSMKSHVVHPNKPTRDVRFDLEEALAEHEDSENT